MPRLLFDRSLEKLHNDLRTLGEMVGDIFSSSIEMLRNNDTEIAKAIMDGDGPVNALEHSIEQSCMLLIARQQPVASDLRNITATLKAITDMERIADQCSDIAEIVLRVEEHHHSNTTTSSFLSMEKVQKMFASALDMYQHALHALLEEDVEEAQLVCATDDVVDTYYRELVTEISAQMAENPNMVHDAVNAILVVKYIERLGDHSTNIAEWAIYRVQGTHPDLNVHQPQ
jgi:phosphate transport system regulatory protein PhoU